MESEILMDQAPVTPMKQPKTPQQPPPSTTDDGRVTQEFRTIEELVEKAIAPVKREYLRPPPSRPSTNNKGDIVEVQNDDVAEAKSTSIIKDKKSKRQMKSKHRNDPSTMKKLHEKHAKKVKKKEVHVSKKRGSNNSGGKIHAKRRRVVEVISRVELPKAQFTIVYFQCSVAIPPHHADVPVSNCQFPELEQLDLPPVSIASYHLDTSSMPSSIGPTNADSSQNGSDKSVEMERANVNQAPSPIKESQHVEIAYMYYYHADVGKELSTQDAFARTDDVAEIEKSLINTIKGLSTPTSHLWNLVNEVFVPINCDSAFHWVLVVIALKE
ncbi:hypothetical protein FXO38_02105 [Capsicum annuum]|nr:hypothetical protein FXO38_02105 [Capsicum annuum]